MPGGHFQEWCRESLIHEKMEVAHHIDACVHQCLTPFAVVRVGADGGPAEQLVVPVQGGPTQEQKPQNRRGMAGNANHQIPSCKQNSTLLLVKGNVCSFLRSDLLMSATSSNELFTMGNFPFLLWREHQKDALLPPSHQRLAVAEIGFQTHRFFVCLRQKRQETPNNIIKLLKTKRLGDQKTLFENASFFLKGLS